jgi:cytoskeletal protein CcmA (bactofilin family)
LARNTNIKLRRSATAGAIPTTSNLDLGELAINTYDGKLFLKKNISGTESIVEIGGDSGTQQTAVYKEYVYTATNNQTSFSGSDDNSQTLSYVVGYLQVFLNGVLLENGTDYTATTGNSVVLVNGAATSDILQISTFVKVLGTGDMVTNTFTGNGSTAAYTLTTNPDTEENTIVFVDGVYQEKDTYTVSGTTLTFDANVPNGASIEVVIGSRNVTTLDAADLSISGDLTVAGEAIITGDIQGDLRGATLFKAKAGEALSKGDVVYISGISGNTTVVSKADADDSAKMPAFGVVAADASLNASVSIYTFGRLSGLDTSSFSEGDELFVSTTAGALTSTAPTGESSKIQKIAKVTRSDNSAGSIFIMGAGRSNAVPNLDDGDIFIGNASNQASTAALNTSIVPESGNLYFTTARVDSHLSGGTGVTYSTGTISIGQDVGTSADVQFNDVQVDGTLTSDDITSTNISVAGNATITGNLTVEGTTTTLNTATLDVEDKNITLNYGSGDTSGSANGAGITIQDAVNSTTDSTILWNQSNSEFDFSHGINVTGTVTYGTLNDGTTALTSTVAELNYLDGVTGITLGSANELLVVGGDGSSIVSDSTLAVDTSNNRLGINQSSPDVTLHMTGEGAQTAQIRMEQYNNSADAPDVRTRRYRGTIASPSAIQSGDYLFRSNHEYYNGSALIVGGQFAFDNTNNANRTQFTVAVTTDGTSVDASNLSDVQFKIDGNDSGAITFNNAYKFPTSDGSSGQVLQTDGSGNLSFATVSSGAIQNLFETIAVSGQSDVVADSATDTLTLAAGTGIAITTNASTDTITITNNATGDNAFGNIAVSGQTTVAADSTNDTLTLVGQNGVAITTDASTDTVTIDGRTSYSPFTTDLFTTADAVTTDFVLSVTPSSEDNLIVFVEGVYQNKNSYSLTSSTLTLSGAPGSGEEVVVHIVSDLISGQSLVRNNFTGDNSTTDFTLTLAPMNENNTFVYLDGVYQEKSEYSVSGTTLSFTGAPASGDSIEVIIPKTTELQQPAVGSIDDATMYDTTVLIPQTVTATTVASTSATTIATHAAATYRTIKYLVQCTQGTDYHSTEINLIHDGTTVYITEYGTLFDNASLGTFNATISSGNILLQITPGSATSMAVKVMSSAIPV